MGERPSYLEVDRWNIASDPRIGPLRDDPEWAAHLSPGSDEVPAWVLALDRPRRRWVWWVPVLGVVVLLVALGLREPYVGVKGGPNATIHLRTGDGSTVWDGVSPLGAGDEIRLALSGLTTPFFAVVYVSPDRAPEVLATGSGGGLLTTAWRFDAPAAGDRLVVVGAPTDLAGRPVREVLAWPTQVVVPLR